MSRIPITDRERVAVVALETIAARGSTLPCKPERIPGQVAGVTANFKCPTCGHSQQATGLCGNRDCLTAIARAALDELRRLA